MYGKYTLFYESPKNWGDYAHAQTVCTRPIFGRERPRDEANFVQESKICEVESCSLAVE